jgi:hypothetical protein
MPITINGSGTVTGISAGGLPDNCITTDDIAADAVTSAKIASGAIVDADVNASAAIADSKLTGTTCKAWVNFDGTSTVAIRASYNVSSITDNGTGNYTVNFTTAMADANYVTVIGTGADGSGGSSFGTPSTYSTTAVIVQSRSISGGAVVDETRFNVAIFR